MVLLVVAVVFMGVRVVALWGLVEAGRRGWCLLGSRRRAPAAQCDACLRCFLPPGSHACNRWVPLDTHAPFPLAPLAVMQDYGLETAATRAANPDRRTEHVRNTAPAARGGLAGRLFGVSRGGPGAGAAWRLPRCGVVVVGG